MTLAADIFEAAGVTARSLERQHNLHLPNGSRLRGIKVMDGLYIARDRNFYRHGPNDKAVHIEDIHVWKMHSFNSLVESVKRLAETRARTMRKRPDDTS